MSHQYELYERVKAVLEKEYFIASHDAKELESGDILVNADMRLVTNNKKQVLNVEFQFSCKKNGIVSRTILKTKAPAHAHKQVVDLITNINSAESFSCFEFDYSDGEIAARNFLQCIDYIPSTATVFTLLRDINAKFMEYGEQLIEAIGVDASELETFDSSDALDVLDEALKGNEEHQTLLLELIRRDPESSYCRRLKEAANNGNGLAQTLLRRFTATTAANNVDVAKVSLPDIIPPNELVKKTLDKARSVLMSEDNDEIPERSFYIEQMNNVRRAASGDLQECADVAGLLFANEDLPQLYDPYLAYQWYALGKALTNDENYMAFRSMPGGNRQGVVDMFYEQMAEMLIMFGSREQKLKALHIMKSYIDKYWGAAFLCTDNFIYALLGKPPCSACRDLGYTLSDVPVNRELATKYYKRMIDDDIANNNRNHAECMAEYFEALLGIKYYTPNNNSRPAKSSSSSSSFGCMGGCYIATCVYGSYDCPQVWTLRRYRDNVLAESAVGRLFIRCYYAVSPHLVKEFGGSSSIRRFWKILLDRIVASLNENGYQNTPYED